MMQLSTINQVVEGILESDITPGLKYRDKQAIANEATIYLMTALICEDKGIDEALKFFHSDHPEDLWTEFATSVVRGDA